MPPAVAFGRRWACGTDDFVFPGILDSIVKSCWLISALLVYFKMEVRDYDSRSQFLTYLFGMMGSLVIIILTDLLVVNRSAKGSIMDTHLRTIIPYLVYLRLFWEALDTGWNTLGTLWVFGPAFSALQIQDPSSFYFVRRYIICNWVSLIILGLFFAFLYDPFGSLDIDSEVQSKFWTKKLTTYTNVWNRSRVEDDVQMLQVAGTTISSIFGKTNLVSSDGIAGLFAHFRMDEDKSLQNRLTQRETYRKISFSISDEKDAESKIFASDLSFSISKVLEMEKFFPYTNGRHNWAKYMKNQHQHKVLNVWNRIRSPRDCSAGRSAVQQFAENGFCRNCKMSSLFTAFNESGIPECDVIYLSFESSYTKVPFCIFLDHKSKSVLLVIVANFSSTAFVAYMDASPVLPGQVNKLQVHGGLYNISENVKLKSHSAIEKLQTSHPNYNLVIIGQSFGAGIAAILGLCLCSKNPGLKVLCLNPPGGLLSPDAAKLSEDFVTSITFGHDLIAQTSLPSLRNFRQRVIDTVYKCQTPKYKLLMGILLRRFGYKIAIKTSKPSTTTGYDNQAHTITMISEGQPEFTLKDENNKSSPEEAMDVKMCLPGKIIHINNPYPNGERSVREPEEIQFQSAQWEQFMEIALYPSSWSDHYNSREHVLNALKKNQV